MHKSSIATQHPLQPSPLCMNKAIKASAETDPTTLQTIGCVVGGSIRWGLGMLLCHQNLNHTLHHKNHTLMHTHA